MIRVLFLCAGNICRSPMAEAVFMHKVKEAGLADKINADSAGTGAWHTGEAAQPGTRSILMEHGISYVGSARQIVRQDFSDFDYIVAMDQHNLRNIQHLMRDSKAQVELFLSFANAAGLTGVQEVPDPYYNDRYDVVYELVEKGTNALLNHIRREHNV